jgi:hypothetical protein
MSEIGMRMLTSFSLFPSPAGLCTTTRSQRGRCFPVSAPLPAADDAVAPGDSIARSRSWASSTVIFFSDNISRIRRVSSLICGPQARDDFARG